MAPVTSDPLTTTPGADMSATLSAAETTRIAALLDRLDPQPGHCEVPGCLHLHVTPDSREGAPALAA